MPWGKVTNVVEPETKKTKKAGKSKDKGKILGNDEEQKVCKPRCKHFPCCFYIPLEIAMEGFALLDIIFYSLSAVICALILTIEPFAGRDPNVPQNHSMGLEYLQELNGMLRMDFEDELEDIGEEADYAELFFEPSTTLGPQLYNPEEYDYDKMSRVYSRIAWYYKNNLQEVDDGCGREYFSDNLFTYQLKITNMQFEQVVNTLIEAYILYAVCGGLLLISLCCFRGYVYSKVMIILLWLFQLVPSYYIITATILSQSKRLCFLQYGLGKHTRGQTIIAQLVLCPILIYKPYELFIWANFIRKFFQNKNGKLMDESIIGQEDSRDFKYMEDARNLTGTDLTKHHYVQFVGGKRLFRQQTSDDKRTSKVPWLVNGREINASSSSED